MPIHPQCKSFLDILAASGGKPLEELPLEDARKVPALLVEFGVPPEPLPLVENRTIPGPVQSIPIRIYRPIVGESLPALVYFHGGGFVICGLDSHDRECRALAKASGSVVVAVDYRLAPEHRYPAATEDAYAATRYVDEHAAEFGIDPSRICVGGDSAGGNLATVVALMARDRGTPSLKFQLMIYPVVDWDDESPSMREYENDHFLTRSVMDWFGSAYFASPAERREPYASPIHADVHGLPPAMIITAECDPLRDQGEAYARKLMNASIPVELKRYEGMIHPFFNLGGVVDTARTAIADAGTAVRRAMEATAPAGA